MMLPSENNTVVVFLATYQGEKYLLPQLSSLEAQTLKINKLYISDDSKDESTQRLCQTYLAQKNLEYTLQKGPQQGFCRNFLSLAENKAYVADYYAFCDQDDIWQPTKLAHAVSFLKEIESTIPALYMARTQLIDENAKPIGFSPAYKRPFSFQNALVQSPTSGNTHVFNHAAKQLLEKTAPAQVVAHDWWLYQLVTGAGGVVIYDKEPTLLYRQHDGNLIGAQAGLFAKVKSLMKGYKGRFKRFNELNLVALLKNKALLTPQNQQYLADFSCLREASFRSRLTLFLKTGIYRQTLKGNLTLWLALLLKKI